jgi:predicted GNAT family acetyltransferase
LEAQDPNIRINESAKRFELTTGDETAYIDFAWHREMLVLLFVYVPIPYRGKGYSSRLIEFAMQLARDKKVKVNVHCSYINRYLRLHPEHQDLLAEI